MKKIKRFMSLLLIISLLSAIFAGTAAAAESRKKVGKINLTIYSDIRLGDSGAEPYAYTSTDHCYVDSVEVINAPENGWSSSHTPTLEITLTTDEDDYYFGSTSSSAFSLSLSGSGSYDGIDFRKATREDDKSTLILTVRLTYGDTIVRAEAPDNLLWDEETGRLTWDEMSNARYYQLQLVKDGSAEGAVIETSRTYYNFGTQIYTAGNYRVKIRSVEYDTNDKSEWVDTRSWYISTDKAAALGANSGAWMKADDGVRNWWRYSDGSWPYSQWINVNNTWYYMDNQGYAVTGWQVINNAYYYFDGATGRMYANENTPDGYWVSASGAWGGELAH